jgi:acyl-CoA thioesterase
VHGKTNGPFVNAAMVAEGTSLVTNLGSAGVGYINGDLTVGLARLPRDEWIGVQADSHWANDGVAVGTATLFDSNGPFGSGMVTAVSNPGAQIDFTNDQFPSRTP